MISVKLGSLLVVLCFLGSSLSACVDSSLGSAELAVNGGFEAGRSPWQSLDPEGWVRVSSVDAGGGCGTWSAEIVTAVTRGACPRTQAGIYQLFVLNQSAPQNVVISAWSRAVEVSGPADYNYAIYVDATYTDGSHLYGVYTTFPVGNHDWNQQTLTVNSTKAIQYMFVFLLFRSHTGTVYFDNLSVSFASSSSSSSSSSTGSTNSTGSASSTGSISSTGPASSTGSVGSPGSTTGLSTAPLGTNLLLNPGFDDPVVNCTGVPDWTQLNTSLLFTTCGEEPWWQHSEPNAIYMLSGGFTGASQTVTLNQDTPYTLNLTTWTWLISCSQQTCWTGISLFGVELDIVYTDDTTDIETDEYFHDFSLAQYVQYATEFTPPKPIATVTVKLVFNSGSTPASVLWDDISLVQVE